jgi:hypothetical protein
MFDLLGRMLRKNKVGPSGGERFPKGSHASSRPQLETLEDRVMPTVLPGVAPPVAVAASLPGAMTASASSSNLQTLTNLPARSINRMSVTVMENSPETIINLDLVFAEMSSLQQEDGLQWSILSNSNAGLVKTDLSEAELTLKYTPGQCGTATIMAGATDADGVSDRESIRVVVKPLQQTTGAMVSPIIVTGE